MLIDDLLTTGAIPSLELTMRFAAQRQALLAHNIANLSTPGVRMQDVSTGGFQRALGRAIEDRRRGTGGMHGDLQVKASNEIRMNPDGSLVLTPTTGGDGVLYHDRNDRDLERLMQAQAENMGVFRLASDLLVLHHRQVRDALGERV